MAVGDVSRMLLEIHTVGSYTVVRSNVDAASFGFH